MQGTQQDTISRRTLQHKGHQRSQPQKPKTELVIIRGLPGSGKSTMARVLAQVGYVHVEADMYFMNDGRYEYDRSQIQMAHAWCRQRVREPLESGQRVVVSNTFTRLQEMEPYLAMTSDARVIEAKGRWQNEHGVPEETLKLMAARWEPWPNAVH